MYKPFKPAVTGAAIAALCLTFSIALHGQVPGASTNMVSGTTWPNGDPFLQRQNEPSMAVSSRNPLHVVAGDNDYRTVDLPFVSSPEEETGDAWLGFFTSLDGGLTWTSTLVPGYPQDISAQGLASPVHGLNAAADPAVRSGPSGMILYSGLAFKRDQSGSSVFLARYIDDNNIEGSSSIRYLDTHLIASGNFITGDPTDSTFLDKPTLAVDIPRGSGTCSVPGPLGSTETIPAFNVYVAFTQFTGPDDAPSPIATIIMAQSQDCGVTWTTFPITNGGAATLQGAQLAIDPNSGSVYLAYRVFYSSDPTLGSISIEAFPAYGGQISSSNYSFLDSIDISPFDQGSTVGSFRTNDYPAIAIDSNSYLYIAWSQRGVALNGDSRIMLKQEQIQNDEDGYPYFGSNYYTTAVDNYTGNGHQVMPALAFSAGKLTAAWYDFRDDDQALEYTPSLSVPGQYTFSLLPQGTLIFQPQIVDPPSDGGSLRHTVDVRAAQAPAPAPGYLLPDSPSSAQIAFQPSVLVSQYAYGTPASSSNTNIEQLEFNAPNLPLFAQGNEAFIGDYIDIAGPTMINDPLYEGWRFNNLSIDPDYTHIVWTDNRNVVPPADGNWSHYTPVSLTAGTTSLFDPTQTLPQSCIAGQTGMRNQDIYTATLSPGLIVGAQGNAKPLSTSLQREFAVTIQNTTSQPASYRLTIQSQPVGGAASFLQFFPIGQPLTQLDITIPGLSTASRSVYITSSDPAASEVVLVQQIAQPGATSVLPNGLNGSIALNPDPANPSILNPNISNPNISNPNISNVEVYNPNISNPNISNPNISNPNISNPNISNPNISNITLANPDILNPNISNPNISNPNISNPNISNPNISNPNISNTAISDVNYIVTNNGNTTASYNLNLIQNLAAPQGVNVQVVVSGIYTTPVANGCTLAVEAHYVPLVNDTTPVMSDPSTLGTSGVPSPTADSFVLQPGEQALVTIRVYDFTTSNSVTALAHYNPATAITPVVVSQNVNTNSALKVPAATLTITTTSLPNATEGVSYSQSLQAIGGTGTGYMFSSDSLPGGLSIVNGVLQGTPSVAGPFSFKVQVIDSAETTATKTLSLSIVSALATQIITFGAIPTQTIGVPLTLSATVNSTLPVIYTSTSTLVCTVGGAQVTFVMPGMCSITASQPGDSTHAAATPVIQTFAVQYGAPTISNLQAVTVGGNAVTVTWTTDQPATSLVNYGLTSSYGLSSTLNSSLVTSHSVVISGLTANTPYYFDVVSQNANGLSATASSATSTFSTRPYVGYVAFWGVNNSGVTISWSTDEPANTIVAYGTTPALGQFSPLLTTLTTSHGVVLTGLNSGTTYYFQAQSTDAKGNLGGSTVYSFTTTGQPTSPAPVISGILVSNITTSSATISWTTDQASTSLVNYGTSTSYGSSSPLNSSPVTSHSVVLTGLTPGAIYDFDVVSGSASGTSVGTSANLTFQTTASTSNPPVISNVSSSGATATTVTVTWTTDQPSWSLVNYGTTASYGLSSTLNTQFVTSHSVTLTGLTPNTTYDFDVVSENAGGVSSTSGNSTFQTAEASTAPAPYVGYVAFWGVNNTGVTISWSTDVAADTELAYGTSATSLPTPIVESSSLSNSHGVVLTTLNPGTTYYFQAVSKTAAGGVGTSTTYSFTTTGTATTPPAISNVGFTSLTANSVTINWTTDQPSSSQVNYGTSTSYGFSTTQDPTLVTSHSVTLSGLLAGTMYNFDVSSGVSTSANYTFTTTGSVVQEPVISNVAATSVTSGTAIVSWTTDQSANSSVNYGTTTSYGSSMTGATSTTSHSVMLSGLSASTTYDFQVVSGTSMSANSTFTTSPGTGKPPVVSYVAFWGATSSGINISWSTDVPATTQVNYGTSMSLGTLSPLQTALTTSHGVVLTGLMPGTIYYFQPQSADANGDLGYSATIYTFTTLAGQPSISNVMAQGKGGNMATISWATSVPTYSYVQYGQSTGNYNRYSAQTSLTASPTVNLGYVPSGTVYYQLVSTDANGNQAVSPEMTFVEP